MKHIFTAVSYRYEKYNQENRSWEPIEALSLKKGDLVRIYDGDTGEQLECERGEKEFRILIDYDGRRRIPYME